MRKSAPIQIVIHGPENVAGQKELAKRVAQVHAQAVDGVVAKQSCSVREKIMLMKAVAETVQERQRETTDREL